MKRSELAKKAVQDLPDATIIWRYYKPDFFLDLVTSSSLYFTQLKSFPDQAEGDIPVYSESILEGTDLWKAYIELRDAPNFWRSYCGASCWHRNDEFSPIMWQEYTTPDDSLEGFAIKTTVGRLKASLGTQSNFGQIKYGAMNYSGRLPTLLPGEDRGEDIVMFYKEPHYAYEQEYRALVYAISNHPISMNTINQNKGVKIPINVGELIMAIYTTPKDPIQSVVLNNLLRSAKLECPLHFISI
jgi:hypothetical protein